MCADLPPPFRLVVKRYGEPLGQGTAWFVTRSKVITAWHVIKENYTLSDVSFQLEIGGEPIVLKYKPESEDREADVAVLHVGESDRPRIQASMVLSLADRKPEQDAEWRARGFPKEAKGEEQTADGHVTNPSTNKGRLELFVNQGTLQTWAGISGAALIIENRVAGIVTAERGHSTALAVPYTAVEKIVPELKGRAHRHKYREWFRDEYQPPDWCRAYTPQVAVNGSTPDSVDKLGDLMIAKPCAGQVWLIVGDEADGREGILRRVVDAFVQNDSIENEDYFDLPVWCTPPSSPKDSVDPLHTTEENLKKNAKGISPSDIEQIIADLNVAINRGRALFIMDGADVEGIEYLRQNIIKNCVLLAGVSESVAAEVHDAQPCRIAALSDTDRRNLATYWVTRDQMAKWVDTQSEFLPLALRPLDVSIWCRAQVIFERLIESKVEKLEEPSEGSVNLLKKLIDCLLSGQRVNDNPRSHGTQKIDETKALLSKLAYLTLIDGVEAIEPIYIEGKIGKGSLGLPVKAAVDIDQVSKQCGLLQKVKDNTYRFTHDALQEYLAASAMNGKMFDLNLKKMAEHAHQIQGKDQIAKWSRALALRLDKKVADAKNILGTLLNYGLSEGYGMQLRNKSGPLSKCVCQAILHTEGLIGKELRKALGWVESPDDWDWTGYRPDEWRDIEELLRYIDGVALRVSDDKALAQLIGRILQEAKIIDIALIRYSLSKELKKRRGCNEQREELEKVYERERFFEFAGHSCEGCDEVKNKIDFRLVPEGWFLMGAPESEERSWPNERPRHRVRLQEYWMTSTEVTNEQYEVFDPTHKAFRLSEEDSKQPDEDLIKKWARHPVVRVSWYEAWCFAEWMGMKLPTEAQWEKAARGEYFVVRPGKISQDPMPYWFSKEEEDLISVAWFKDNSDGHTSEVDRQPSNSTKLSHPFELGGLCGNVWEWCMDEQGFKYTEDDREGADAEEAFEKQSDGDVITNRIIRGGSYNSPAWNCRHAVRHFTFPTVRADTIGFRLCTDSPPE
jgi:formylglycine-generating enzyme required for sulfatase activity